VKIAIQGIAGSFHHEAAKKMLGDKIEIIPCNTFQQVFEAVHSNQVKKGVVAIENSLFGSINSVYRLLPRYSLWICNETYLHINQYLIAANPIEVQKITTVLSQGPAFAQCELWMEENLSDVLLEEIYDTAESVRRVISKADKPWAAIASKYAATLYGGTIIAGPINDNKQNFTRFIVISKDKSIPKNATKTSIILKTSHRPAALYHALGVFAEAKINLSKLDSHPIVNDKQHYAFYIDFEAPLNAHTESETIEKLRSQGCRVTILGSYKTTT